MYSNDAKNEHFSDSPIYDVIFPKLVRKLAFTLAEVLIVLGIIGIIAEQTIPTLMNDVQNKTNIVAWKKNYSVLSQVYLRMQNDNLNTYSSSINLRDNFIQYMSVLKTCDTAGADCWHATGVVKTLPLTNNGNASVVGIDGSSEPGAILTDGTKLIFNRNSDTEGWVIVDVNGDKKPNVIGKDIFGAVFDQDKLQAWQDNSFFGTCSPATAGADSRYAGFGCSQYYLLNG